ncbi:hypothetical protein AAGT13_20855 [Azotobacter salinestris]
MNTSQFEAAKARAEKTIRRYVEMLERNGSNGWPTESFCEGLITMAYTTGHLNDVGVQYWKRHLKRIKEAHWKSVNVKIGAAA